MTPVATIRSCRSLLLVLAAALAAPASAADPGSGAGSFCEALREGLPASVDATYGYSSDNPVKLGGGGDKGTAQKLQKLYLGLLLGPNGERVKTQSVGIGGAYRLPDKPEVWANVEKYRLRSKGLRGDLFIYLSAYDYDTLRIPQGLTIDAEQRDKLLAPGGYCSEEK